MRRKVLSMAGVAFKDFIRNNCPYMAAGIAYWTLFSVFPLALAGIAIMGYFSPSPEQQVKIVEGIVGVFPVSEDEMGDLVQEIVDARGTLSLLAIVGFLWTGSAVFSAVRKGVNHAWHIRTPAYFLIERAIDFVMLLGVAALALAHIVFTTNLLGISTLASSVPDSGVWVILRVFYEFLVFAFTFGAFVLLYRFVPHTKVVWSDIWPGALVGAVLFEAVRMGLAWYMSGFGNLNLIYGSLGAIMAVVVWAYLSAMAIMLGAQTAYTYRGVFGTHAGEIVLPAPKPKVPGQRRSWRGLIATPLSWLLPPKDERQ